ncbi:hydroxymethylbilane synthase [Streptomyces sp. DvalAA-19]|uniref:hydroxymethylbilane synthase n=1 Tax=Streptomyces sp. DvalAA-19 TaxID=1839761 RepID=UPI00081B44E8|nr:hydroxymethylbilane synthase [Streptomyces sp. DvalAA-19]SCE09376.1 hydroxymethylbilane synthase [Streptomyces sp. DvalAA-19]
MNPLRVGARASKMSLMQTAPVLASLAPAVPTILRPFTGAGGDRTKDRAPLESDGVFSDEIEAALVAGEIDVAVHCLKDAPTLDTPGLAMAGFLRRDDIRDCLVTRRPGATLATLPVGANVATASLRRPAALRIHRPDITVRPLRGPVDMRLQAMDDPKSGIDALIVAACSMERLGLAHRIAERISPEILCPPLGAAIIASQTREDDTATREAIQPLHDPETGIEAAAERLVLLRMGGFCNAPLAGYCTTNSGTDGTTTYTVRAQSFTPDGTTTIDVRRSGSDPAAAAVAASHELARLGAMEFATAQSDGLSQHADAGWWRAKAPAPGPRRT